MILCIEMSMMMNPKLFLPNKWRSDRLLRSGLLFSNVRYFTAWCHLNFGAAIKYLTLLTAPFLFNSILTNNFALLPFSFACCVNICVRWKICVCMCEFACLLSILNHMNRLHYNNLLKFSLRFTSAICNVWAAWCYTAHGANKSCWIGSQSL